MRIQDRYASAIHSSNLEVDERTTFSDTDVLGAMGLASRRQALGVALTRLFGGDNGASGAVVDCLAKLIVAKGESMRRKIPMVQAVDMARACLAWHRDGACRPCGGHGVMRIPGTKTLGVVACKSCKPTPHAVMGTGKRPFERAFHPDRREMARWVVAEMEKAQAYAGPAAMEKLANRLDF